MELSRIDDIAARQSIDSMRVFREFLRVRRELDAMPGSLFWKKVGEYEYLAHKVGGTTTYKGPRSPSTEAQFNEFIARKTRLKDRYQSLKETVEASQRMNKAVHAGAVPTEIVEVLTLIEQQGLTNHSLVVGAPALYAFSQSSGVNLHRVTLGGKPKRLLGGPPESLRILIQRPKASAPDTVMELRKALSKFAVIKEESPKRSRWMDLIVYFCRDESKRSARPGEKAPKTAIRAKATPSIDWAWTGRKREPQAMTMECKSVGHSGWDSTEFRRLEHLLEHTPSFEQVVVGKTGKMAIMRTFDPQAFVVWGRAVHAAKGPVRPDDIAELPVRLVEEMIDAAMVVTKLDETSSAALSEEVHALVDESVASKGTPTAATASLALLTGPSYFNGKI